MSCFRKHGTLFMGRYVGFFFFFFFFFFFDQDQDSLLVNISVSILLCQPRKEDIRTGAQRIRAKKKERIKSRIGKVNKLRVMLQKRLKTVKNKCCGLGHEM